MSVMLNPSEDWKTFGATNPFYGVLSDKRLKSHRIDEAAIDRFYETGCVHVDKVMAFAEATLGGAPSGKALDFGCGVGRLTNALAGRFESVVGVDISTDMLVQARLQAAQRNVTNVTYGDSLDARHLRPGSYDFVHTYLVLQHIPVGTGEEIIRDMVASLRRGGMGAIHFTYGYARNAGRERVKNLLKKHWLSRGLGNIAIGRPFDEPAMQMNCYDIPRVIDILHAGGASRLSLARVDDWGNLGAFVFFRKTGEPDPWSNPRT